MANEVFDYERFLCRVRKSKKMLWFSWSFKYEWKIYLALNPKNGDCRHLMRNKQQEHWISRLCHFGWSSTTGCLASNIRDELVLQLRKFVRRKRTLLFFPFFCKFWNGWCLRACIVQPIVIPKTSFGAITKGNFKGRLKELWVVCPP